MSKLSNYEIEEILKLYPQYDRIYGPYLRKDGRMTVVLSDGRTTSSRQLARVRLDASLARRLVDDETVDHLDNDFTNDHISKYHRRDGHIPRKDIEQTCVVCNRKFF